MTKTDPLKLLLEEQRALHAAAQAVLEAVERAEPVTALLGQRMHFAKLVSGHMASEQKYLFAALTAEEKARLPGYRRTADALQELRLAYTAHVCRWTAKAIEEDQEGYRQSLRTIILRLEVHMKQKARDFYAPAFRLIETRVIAA